LTERIAASAWVARTAEAAAMSRATSSLRMWDGTFRDG
jgi:hypothetical protein